MIQLCQPDRGKSCGACCGLYNWHDYSRATLTAMLRQRRELFFSLGDPPDLDEYSRIAHGLISGPKLLDDIYNCEFLGFLDEDGKRVGCLLHPAVNRGLDLRDRSFYGPRLCAGHLCQSYVHLTEVEKLAVIKGIHDWYLYGLVITDIDFVKDFVRHAQDILGDALRIAYLDDPKVRAALGDYFGLKENWSFSSAEPRLGKYYFTHSEYRVARIEYRKKWKIEPSRFDKILVSLSSEFETERDVREAEAIIEERIRRFVRAYEEAVKGMPSEDQQGG